MIQKFHFCVYTQKKWKQGFEQIFHSSIIYNSQKVETTQMS